jgi:prepilin-type N-terminal cleavage/methylation domain-containing protein
MPTTYPASGRPRNGFTLIELVVAIALAVIAITAVTAIFVEGMKNVREVTRLERLHESAILVSGDLSHWIKAAAAVTIPSSSTLSLTLLDGTTTTIALTGGTATMNGGALTPSNVAVRALSFTRMTDSVKTNFTLGLTDGSETYSATSVVAIRNSF